MKVLVQRDCLGGERIVEIELPRPVRLEDLDRIEGVETRTVLAHLPRPFFRLDVPGRFLLTGIVSDPRVRFTVRMAVRDRALELALEAAERLAARSTS
ncbi:MAG: hypothetical protein VYE22_30015 [Myxococcota bacterium]|nr:hypothetical protein [Myxococcota bacterium]